GLPEMAVGAVAECWFAGGPVLLLRETAQRFLLVVDADRAVGAWQELFEAGRAVGLSMVGTEALDRLAAAPRVCRGSEARLQPPPSGVPSGAWQAHRRGSPPTVASPSRSPRRAA